MIINFFLDLQYCQWFIVALSRDSSRCRTANIPRQHITKGKKLQRRNYGIFSQYSYKQRTKFWMLRLAFPWYYWKSNGWCLYVPAFSDYGSAFWALTVEDIEPIVCAWKAKAAWCSEQCGEQNSSQGTTCNCASPQDGSCLSLCSGTRGVTSLLPKGKAHPGAHWTHHKQPVKRGDHATVVRAGAASPVCCVEFWAPQLKKDVKEFKWVQRRAAKIFKRLEGMSCVSWLKALGMSGLERRMLRDKLIAL